MQNMAHPIGSARRPRRKLSATSAGDLEKLTETLRLVAEEVPERTTVRQLLAFVLVAYKEAMGSPITLKGIQHAAPIIGQSIERSLDTFRQPTKRSPAGLDWIDSEEDTDDRRLKYLRLTDKGVTTIEDILDALREGPDE